MECNQLLNPSESDSQRGQFNGAFNGFKFKRIDKYSSKNTLKSIRKYFISKGFC